ncbi:hypothetical protein NC652_006787 [Populus alba x Populus x berolinensis]|nr:hypothetical protein NC652_006787 [Populus alba x Populus x berolinensis]
MTKSSSPPFQMFRAPPPTYGELSGVFLPRKTLLSTSTLNKYPAAGVSIFYPRRHRPRPKQKLLSDVPISGHHSLRILSTKLKDLYSSNDAMGRAKKGPKFAKMKKMITSRAIKQHKEEVLNPKKKDLSLEKLPRNVPQVSSALFFSYNTALGPPYRVLVDTNFINFSIQNKLDLEKAMLDCLYAKCTPCITDCVMAELEKLGQKYRVALRIAKDPRFERLPCIHKGTYADDCIVERVTNHKCYVVATCDRDLKRRIRKIPGVPIMYITQHKYSIERLPEATVGGAPRSGQMPPDYIFYLKVGSNVAVDSPRLKLDRNLTTVCQCRRLRLISL